jgi:glycosyltransferase involved in cell wall biosynthesis
MKIGIYDTEHFETTVTLIRILDTNETSIILFITPGIATALNALEPGITGRHTIVLLQQGHPLNAYRIYRYCRKHQTDILFLNTVAFHHFVFGALLRLLKKTRVALTIHDANSFFQPQATPGIRNFLRARGKRWLAKNVHYYITLLSSIRTYIQEQFHPAQPVFVVPGSVYAEQNEGASGNSLVIVVPGSVDPARRDYSILFQALALLKEQPRSLEFVILGGTKDAAANQIIMRCREFEGENLVVSAWDDAFVSQQEYDRQLARADFIYLPLQTNFYFESAMPEKYGLTKSSGVFFDAVRFGKPLLLPSQVHVPEELKQQSIVHHSAGELASFLLHVSGEQLQDISRRARENAAEFSLETVREKLASLINRRKSQ